MTEEEKIEWAKTHTWTPRQRSVHDKVIASTKRSNAKSRVKTQISNAKAYANPEQRKKHWGDEYNARIRYLYQHNEEFRELKKFRVSFRLFQKRKYQYDAWTVKYYTTYKNKMQDNAQTFRIEGTQNFMHGYTLKDLKSYSPVGQSLLTMFISQNILPAPKYRGHKFVKDKISEDVEEFYLVQEVEELLNVFARYRKKFGLVKTDEQKAFLKKQFWTRMRKVRENFDND